MHHKTGAIALSALLSACGAPSPSSPQDPDIPASEPIRRALVIGIDGMRADAFAAANTPHLDALFPERCRTLRGATHMTGETLVSGPGWTSILTGAEVEDHGVTSNEDLGTREAAWPTFLERTRSAGYSTAAAVHWLGIVPILGGDATNALETGDDAAIGTLAAALIAEHDLVFVHFDDVDGAGHGEGFSPDVTSYVETIELTDQYVGVLRDALTARPDEESWLVAMVTDHGGFGTDHRERVEGTEVIPLGVCAEGVDITIPELPSHMDAAPSVLDWLGVAHEGLDGTSWLR